jgi:hypothetical protein
VLGEGELSKPLVIKAASFSAAAADKISAAGATAEKLAGRATWTRRAHEKKVRGGGGVGGVEVGGARGHTRSRAYLL